MYTIPRIDTPLTDRNVIKYIASQYPFDYSKDYLILSQGIKLSVKSSILFQSQDSKYYFTEYWDHFEMNDNNGKVYFTLPLIPITNELAIPLMSKFKRLIAQNKGTYVMEDDGLQLYQKAEYHGTDLSTVNNLNVSGYQYILDNTFSLEDFTEMWIDLEFFKQQHGYD